MNSYSFLVIFMSILSLYSGIYILLLGKKSASNKVFFLICLAGAVWIFSSLFAVVEEHKNGVIFWDRISTISSALFWALNLHFYILLAGKRLKKYQYALIYIPGFAVIIQAFTSMAEFSDYVNYQGQWKFVPATDSIWIYVYLLYAASYSICFFIILYCRGKKSRLRKERLQSKVILSTSIILLLIGIHTDFILPMFDFYRLPAIGSILFGFYIITIWYALKKYRFMIVRPSIVSDEIIAHIQDMVLLLDQHQHVVMVNRRVAELMKINEDDFKHRSINDFIFSDEVLKSRMHKIISGEESFFNSRLNYKIGEETVITDTYFSRIVDKFGDCLGILLISKENPGVKQFLNDFKITRRQLEIVELSISGLSNKEISEQLELSGNTVETHFVNIYNKLGINNRIELFNIAKRYNLMP